MGKDARWEEMNTYNPAAVVKDGKVYLLYRADGHNPECGWGRVCRIGLAVSEDGIHFTRRPEPVLYPANYSRCSAAKQSKVTLEFSTKNVSGDEVAVQIEGWNVAPRNSDASVSSEVRSWEMCCVGWRVG